VATSRAPDPADLSHLIIGPGDPDMLLVHKQHACALPYRIPDALIRCRSEDEVAEALRWVTARDLSFSVRSGGHCFSDFSTSGKAVIDLGAIDHVAIEGDIVRIGPGALSGDVVQALCARGLSLPTGGCPLVALGGLSLVGGFGFLGRAHGLTTDRLAWARVLLADGSFVTADETDHADLFWALRGAGTCGFGIVTELGLRHVPAQPALACTGTWTIDEAAELIDHWQLWAPHAPGEANIELSLLCPDDVAEPCHIRLYGLFFGSEREALRADLRTAIGRFGKALRSVEMDPATAARHAAGLITQDGEDAWLPSRPFQRVAFQATRSGFFEQRLPASAVAAMVERFQQERGLEGREIEFAPWRGAYARETPGASFSHRNAHFLVRHTGIAGSRSTPEDRGRVTSWAEESAAILAPFGNGRVYQGYAEAGREDWARAYYGGACDRLGEIKAQYDPQRRFAWPQTIGRDRHDGHHPQDRMPA
jgi:FAD/FMN-containing dehydrogenase